MKKNSIATKLFVILCLKGLFICLEFLEILARKLLVIYFCREIVAGNVCLHFETFSEKKA